MPSLSLEYEQFHSRRKKQKWK